MRASLFVSTYEMPKHLSLVCAGLERQTAKDFEIFFCDDGSGPETREIIAEFQKRSSIPSHHLWQKNEGFRKCRILNQALRKASGDICIFLDGDCVPHQDFVKDHLENQEKGFYLAGRRVELGPLVSATLTSHQVRAGYFDRPAWSLIRSILKGDSQYLNRCFRIASPRLRHLLGMDRIVDLKGCNYSVPREALEAINGFDEAYEGYGREDTDVEIRLKNLGLKIKSLKGVALQFHVWHPRREFTPSNDRMLEEVISTGRVRCAKGLAESRA